MSRNILWEELAVWAHPCIQARSEGGPALYVMLCEGTAIFLERSTEFSKSSLISSLTSFFSFSYRIALVGSKTITLKDWDIKDARSPDLGIRAASDAGIRGSGTGRNDQKREPGKMGGVGLWHLLSCSPIHLLVLEWVCSGIQLNIEIFSPPFFLFSFLGSMC